MGKPARDAIDLRTYVVPPHPGVFVVDGVEHQTLDAAERHNPQRHVIHYRPRQPGQKETQ